MTTQIHLNGIIGFDVTPSDIRQQLAAAVGPVELLIHSPGGNVYDGFAIHNAIRDFRRAGGHVKAIISGIAASMATYVAMAAESIAVEDNAVFMIHNPSMLALGDHREMRKAADLLDSLAGVLARAYQTRIQRDARPEMDVETYLFGADIVAAGYAETVIPAGDGAEERGEALALARHAVQSMTAKLRESETASIDQIAALLPTAHEEMPMSHAPQATELDEPSTETPETPETPDEEAEDQPDITALVQQALAADRARIQAITARCAQVGMPALASALIAENATLAQTDARIVDAWVSAGGPEIRSFAQTDKPTADVSAAQRKLLAQVAGRIQE